jgi:hypothetical protein
MAVTVVPCANCGGGSGPGPGPDPAECEPVPMCARFTGISGPDQWSLPADVESFTIDVICGPITVTDCGGEATIVNECGSIQFGAPSLGCNPGVFCTPFTVDVPEGSSIYVKYNVPCGSV